MVRQIRRMDRCFLPAAGGGVAKVRFPAGPPAQQAPGSCDARPHGSRAAAREKRAADGRSQGGQGSDGGSGEAQLKRARQNGTEAAAALTNRSKAPGSCDPAGDGSGSDQQGAAEDSRAAQLQSVASLKVTIQQSSDSRAFGPADRSSAALRCHVCNLTCRSPQVFQDHMSGREHLRKLQDITQSVQLNAGPLLDRGRRPQAQRWCDTCQVHFSGDIIAHRRTEQHKVCKQQGRPFCPVCQRHFRTPRKFVEHIKSVEHKEQVQLGDEQEEELITVDAVGCFEEEEEEVEVVDEDEESAPSEVQGSETVDAKESEEEEEEEDEFDPQLTYGKCRWRCSAPRWRPAVSACDEPKQNRVSCLSRKQLCGSGSRLHLSALQQILLQRDGSETHTLQDTHTLPQAAEPQSSETKGRGRGGFALTSRLHFPECIRGSW